MEEKRIIVEIIGKTVCVMGIKEESEVFTIEEIDKILKEVKDRITK